MAPTTQREEDECLRRVRRLRFRSPPALSNAGSTLHHRPLSNSDDTLHHQPLRNPRAFSPSCFEWSEIFHLRGKIPIDCARSHRRRPHIEVCHRFRLGPSLPAEEDTNTPFVVAMASLSISESRSWIANPSLLCSCHQSHGKSHFLSSLFVSLFLHNSDILLWISLMWWCRDKEKG